MNIRQPSFAPALAALGLFAAGLAAQAPPAAPGGAAPAVSAEQQTRALLRSLEDGDASALWESLPQTWRGDLNGLVQLAAKQIDAKTYDRAMQVGNRTLRLLEAKREFVLGSKFTPKDGMDPAERRRLYDAGVALAKTLADSELGSHAGLVKFDGRAFFAKTGSSVLQQMYALANATGKQPLAALRGTKVRTLKQDEKRAVLGIAPKNGEEERTEFTLVEDRWVPSQLAQGWNRGVGQARKALQSIPTKGDRKTQVLVALGAADAALEQLEGASTQEEFDEIVAGLIQAKAAAQQQKPAGKKR